ncbi:UNVERIFIED_CONTAM: hypothetical protein GTU68_036748, partial [Idotea baltica]|nr:hypothetical protein [Idotea baltica]
MIDHVILPIQHRILRPLAKTMVNKGLTADHVSFGAFSIGLLSVIFIAFGAYGIGLALILLNRLGDGLDGIVARMTQPTDRGAYFDIVLDFVFYALVPLGFAFSAPATNALPAAVLITSF